MPSPKLILSAVALVVALSAAGPTTGSAQGACLSIGAPEVDFGLTLLHDDRFSLLGWSEVKNNCGEAVDIEATAYAIAKGEWLNLTKNECAKKTLAAKATCQLQFTFKPEKVGKYAGLMGLKYSSVKIKPEWYEFEVTGTGRMRGVFNKAGPMAAAGELTIDASSGLSIDCYASGAGEIWNEAEEEGAAGEFSSLGLSSCGTNLPNCEVPSASAENLPWAIASHEALEEAELDLLDLTGLKATFEFSSGCAVYGLPKTVWLTGSVTGTFENSTSCLEWKGTEGLLVAGLIPVTLSGELCVTEPEGLELE